MFFVWWYIFQIRKCCKWNDIDIQWNKQSVRVRVCECVREREREREDDMIFCALMILAPVGFCIKTWARTFLSPFKGYFCILISDHILWVLSKRCELTLLCRITCNIKTVKLFIGPESAMVRIPDFITVFNTLLLISFTSKALWLFPPAMHYIAHACNLSGGGEVRLWAGIEKPCLRSSPTFKHLVSLFSCLDPPVSLNR